MSAAAAAKCSKRSVALAVLAFRPSSHNPSPLINYSLLGTHSQFLPPNPHQFLINGAVSPPSAWLTSRRCIFSSSASSAAICVPRPAQPARQLSGAGPAAKVSQQAAQDNSTVADVRNVRSIEAGEVSEYWGIARKQSQREDGSPWPWHCFRPADTYTADIGIDVERHYPADRSWVDRCAYWTVRALRGPVDLFFKERHVSHALLLETVAGVPGMVGGMLLHLRSLRRFEQSGGWIKALLEEAENERMHLMTWVEVLRPAWWERALVLAVQGTFFNAYFLLYLASPRLAHRFVGYLEEEAVRSYSDFLQAIDVGHYPNGPAPLIAIDYWRLPANATIRDVVRVIRADEAHHRDVNHFAADVYKEKRELCKSPAPIGYH